jgi:hypothetical protein
MAMRECNIAPDEQGTKNPALAGALNLLPGVGNFYLAVGSGESSQWAFGGLNLWFWPFSVVWGIPSAAIDAGTINKKMTLDHYRYTRWGKKTLKEKCAEAGVEPPF